MANHRIECRTQSGTPISLLSYFTCIIHIVTTVSHVSILYNPHRLHKSAVVLAVPFNMRTWKWYTCKCSAHGMTISLLILGW